MSEPDDYSVFWYYLIAIFLGAVCSVPVAHWLRYILQGWGWL